MPVFNYYQAGRRSRLFFLSASVLIHVVLLIGVSLLLFPNLIEQTSLPSVEVVILQGDSQVSSQAALDRQQVTVLPQQSATPIDTAEQTEVDIVAVDRVRSPVSEDSINANASTSSVLQLSAELIHKITADLFAQIDKNSNRLTRFGLPSVTSISSYVSNSAADRLVSSVAFYFPSGDTLCAQFSEPNPLDSFDPGYWWLTSTSC